MMLKLIVLGLFLTFATVNAYGNYSAYGNYTEYSYGYGNYSEGGYGNYTGGSNKGFGKKPPTAAAIKNRVARILASRVADRVFTAVKELAGDFLVVEPTFESPNITVEEISAVLREVLKLYFDTDTLPPHGPPMIQMVVQQALQHVDFNYDQEISLSEVVRFLVQTEVLPVKGRGPGRR